MKSTCSAYLCYGEYQLITDFKRIGILCHMENFALLHSIHVHLNLGQWWIHLPKSFTKFFIQGWSNSRGCNVKRRVISTATSTWIDQQNMLDHMYSLEEKLYLCSIHFFLDSRHGCIVLDDELIASKAVDVKNKLITDHKIGREGLCCDVICNSFVQSILVVRIRTIVDSKLENL